MTDTGKTAIAVVVAIVICIVCFFCGHRHGVKSEQRRDADTVVVFRSDTLVRRDTVVLEKLVCKEVRIVDTLTLHVSDSVIVYLPREQKVFASEDYRAVISGVQPQLDSMTVYPQTQIITQTTTQTVTKEAPRWSFSAAAGPGVMVDFQGGFHFGVGAVVGIAYRF